MSDGRGWYHVDRIVQIFDCLTNCVSRVLYVRGHRCSCTFCGYVVEYVCEDLQKFPNEKFLRILFHTSMLRPIDQSASSKSLMNNNIFKKRKFKIKNCLLSSLLLSAGFIKVIQGFIRPIFIASYRRVFHSVLCMYITIKTKSMKLLVEEPFRIQWTDKYVLIIIPTNKAFVAKLT